MQLLDYATTHSEYENVRHDIFHKAKVRPKCRVVMLNSGCYHQSDCTVVVGCASLMLGFKTLGI